MTITSLDHFVLTVIDIPKTLAFYQQVLGMEARTFASATGEQRWALHFGQCKINLHQAGQEFEPKAQHPVPGSADLCFISDSPVQQIVEQLESTAVQLLEGPVFRTGATGPLCSIYFRDPDGNLIEVSNQQAGY